MFALVFPTENVTSVRREKKARNNIKVKIVKHNFKQHSFHSKGLMISKILFCKIDEFIKNSNARVKMRMM